MRICVLICIMHGDGVKVYTQDSRDLRTGFWLSTGSLKLLSFSTPFHLMEELVVKVPAIPFQSILPIHARSQHI